MFTQDSCFEECGGLNVGPPPNISWKLIVTLFDNKESQDGHFLIIQVGTPADTEESKGQEEQALQPLARVLMYSPGMARMMAALLLEPATQCDYGGTFSSGFYFPALSGHTAFVLSLQL